ncbi:MAG TPA: hypothetical protein VFL36_19845 [Myxococcales bacterium]|nr:hypothetical protein [Myxococcales bacterium]
MGYAEERLDLVARLRRQAPGRSLTDLLRLDGRELRFHVGTSLADLRVPVHVDAAVGAAVRAAVRDLFFLLSIRHRASLREREYDRLILLDGFDPKGARQVSFNAPASVKSDNVRRAFLEAPELHPALDAGLMASWLTTGRPGRTLAGILNALLRRAQAEAGGPERPEPTPYLVLLALRSRFRTALHTLKDLPVSGPIGRTLHGAVAAGLLVALRLATREAGVLTAASGALCEAATSALPALGGQRALWGSGLLAYGVAFSEALPTRVDAYAEKILLGASPEAVARDVAIDAAGSREAARRAVRQVALARMRADLLGVLRMMEVGRAPLFSLEGITLSQLVQTPGALERVLGSPSGRRDLLTRTRSAARTANHEPARKALSSIASAAKEWKDEDPGGWIPQRQAVDSWAEAIAALAADEALESALDQAELQLAHRTGSESEGGIETQHEAGKLYLLAVDEKPILMGRARSPQLGHLFCDMKDFTKRTAFLKETVVADFLSREFYGPILTAAARHAQGAAHLADKGGIYLNNLLGDAVSFSGDVVALLELADDIRRALGSYALRLDTEGSREAVAKATAAIEERYRARRELLLSAARSAQEALRRGTLDRSSGDEPGTRLRMLEAEVQRLEVDRQAEISLATGEKLEAGIFISYGAAPEVATFEDHIFGQIKVSIAEKINESARGTARNAGVRARVDALLDAERGRLRRPDLVCPLLVSVSQPLSMPVPPDVEMAMRQSLAEGDQQGAEAALSGAVRELVGRLASEDAFDDRGDIYNGGVALSDEALRAYLSARKHDLVFLRREVEVGTLHPDIGGRFVFPAGTLRLVAAVSPATQGLQELFVYVGRALFRGFERQSGLGIYEMVARENPFFLLLAEHHVAGWLAEHEASGKPAAVEWTPPLVEERGT